MLLPIRGTILGVAAMFLWGSVNASFRHPASVPGWGFATMCGVLALAVGHQLFGVRAKGDFGSRMVGRFVVSSLLSVALAAATVSAGLIVERVLAPVGTAWGDTMTRAIWHGLAVLTIGVAVSPGAPRRRTDMPE